MVVVAHAVDDRDGARIGKLHDAFLDALEVIAGPCQYDEHEEIDHGANRGLRLADTDGLDKDNVTAGSFAEEHSLTGFSRDTAQSAFGWRWSNEAVRFTRQVLHTCLITKDRAAGDG